MTEKQRLILHIGLHKTGTTYLQKMFAHNLDLFAKAGVVPAPVFDAEAGNHHKLRRLLADGKDEEFFAHLEGLDGTILITTESFTHLLSRYDDDTLNRFAQRLMDRFDLRVVLVIRRQDYLKESVYAEVATHHFRGKIKHAKEYYYDLNAFVQRLEDAFGHDRIALGVYRDDRRGDLMGEFLALAGIDLDPATLEQVPPQRVSLHRRKVALLATFPKKPFKPYRIGRAAVAKSDVIPDDGMKYQMSPKERRNFLRQYHESNRILAQRFGLDADTVAYLTSDDLDDKPWAPVAPFTDEERAVYIDAREAALDEAPQDDA